MPSRDSSRRWPSEAIEEVTAEGFRHPCLDAPSHGPLGSHGRDLFRRHDAFSAELRLPSVAKKHQLTNKEAYSLLFKGTWQKLTNMLILLLFFGIQGDVA
jgi:hypothetical protein